MTDRIETDAQKMKLLIREAEAVTDEAAMLYARLKQIMIASRQNPEVPIATGQAALRRLNEAEAKLHEAASQLFRVHGELNALIPIVAGDDGLVKPTEVATHSQPEPTAA